MVTRPQRLPAIPETIELKSVLHMLSPLARIRLGVEIADWQRRAPERLTDEASLRYIFMSVLDFTGEPCPHPFRLPLPGYALSFECRMCRSYIMYNKELNR